MGKLRLEIVTPRDVLLDLDELSWIQVPLTDGGELGILPGHAPLVAATVTGSVRYATDSDEEQFEAPAGILKVRRNVITIFVSILPDNAASPFTFGRSSRLANSALAGNHHGDLSDG